MAVYTYPQSKVIDEIIFRKTEKGTVRAYLHARPGISQEKIQHILDIFENKDFQVIPFNLNGRPMLEVHGVRHEKKFLALLDEHQWIDGLPTIHTPKEEQIGWKDKLKKRSLQASGAFYVVGDYNFFRKGVRDQQWEDMLAGIMYAGGTMSLLGYGRNDQSDIQIQNLSRRITRHILKEGVKLPPHHILPRTAEEKDKGLLSAVNGTLKQYPSEIFNFFTGLAGACIAASALRHRLLSKPPSDIERVTKEAKIFRTAGWLDLGLGTITMASTALGGLVDERAPDPDKPKSHGVQAMLDWVKERPLTIAGAGLMVSTGLHAISSWLEYHQAKRLGHEDRLAAIKNRSWFVATNLAAEFLIAISSKGHGHGVQSDKSVYNSVVALTADLIAKQPEAMQESLIDYMAHFLGRPDVLAVKNEEVKKMLHEQVEAMRKNPWAAATQALPAETSEPSIAAPVKEKAPAWQAKIAAQETAAASPQLSA